MAEEIKDTQTVDEEVDTQQTEDENKEENTLTQDEVNRLIAQSKSKAKDEARKELEAELRAEMEDELEEAKRLAEMNEDEKREHEFKQMKDELEKLKQREVRHGLAQEASKMLSEHSIQADDQMLGFVVKETAEETQEAVNSFIELVTQKVDEGVKQALAGRTPKVGGVKNSSVSQADFKQMTYMERKALKDERPEQYKQLLKGE